MTTEATPKTIRKRIRIVYPTGNAAPRQVRERRSGRLDHAMNQALTDGSGEIRTHGTLLTYTHFPDRGHNREYRASYCANDLKKLSGPAHGIYSSGRVRNARQNVYASYTALMVSRGTSPRVSAGVSGPAHALSLDNLRQVCP